jgi:hypothetical protein
MNRGEVVEVNWPYSDLMGLKIRPAVVVQADFLNGLLNHRATPRLYFAIFS